MELEKIILFILMIGMSSLIQGQSSLQKAVNAFSQAENLKNASIGIDIVQLDNDQQLASFNRNTSLSPASSLKLFVTGIALEKLGSDFKFETGLYYTGQINSGKLIGDIIIIGSGDPSLGSDQMIETLNYRKLMKAWSNKIKALGIKQIEGNIIADASCFDSQMVPASYPWIDLGNYYAAGVSGLNIHENLYYLSLEQNPKFGASPSCCGTDPSISGLEFNNELTSAAANSGDNAYIYGAPYSYSNYIRGTIPLGNEVFTIKGAIPDPSLLTAQLLLKELKEFNIEISGSAKSIHSNPEKLNPIHKHYSPSLQTIVNRTNLKSVNVYSEALLKTLGKKFSDDGSYNGGLNYVKSYLVEKRINTEGFFMMDGSGLSLNNGIAARHFTDFLAVFFKNKILFNKFSSSLAVSGQSGSMKNLLNNTDAEGKFWVKSGSMERVRSYTGYALTNQGIPVAFSFIVTNYSGSSRALKAQLEHLMLQIFEYK